MTNIRRRTKKYTAREERMTQRSRNSGCTYEGNQVRGKSLPLPFPIAKHSQVHNSVPNSHSASTPHVGTHHPILSCKARVDKLMRKSSLRSRLPSWATSCAVPTAVRASSGTSPDFNHICFGQYRIRQLQDGRHEQGSPFLERTRRTLSSKLSLLPTSVRLLSGAHEAQQDVAISTSSP